MNVIQLLYAFQTLGHLLIYSKNKESDATQLKRITGINRIKGVDQNEDAQAETLGKHT
jgi:hypothetical protein